MSSFKRKRDAKAVRPFPSQTQSSEADHAASFKRARDEHRASASSSSSSGAAQRRGSLLLNGGGSDEATEADDDGDDGGTAASVAAQPEWIKRGRVLASSAVRTPLTALGVPPRLIDTLRRQLGIDSWFAMQAEVIPAVLSARAQGHECVARSIDQYHGNWMHFH